MHGRLDKRSGGHEIMNPGDAGKELIRLALRADKDLRPLPARISIATAYTKDTPEIWPLLSYVNLTATIAWANDGAEAEFSVDVCRGIVVTAGPCQSLAVTLHYGRSGLKNLNDGPQLRVSASAVYGITAGNIEACSAISFERVPANGYTPLTRIPAFARTCQVTVDNANPRPSVILRLYGDNTPVIPPANKSALAEFDMNQNDIVPIIKGAEFFQLVQGGPGSAFLTASWNLYS